MGEKEGKQSVLSYTSKQSASLRSRTASRSGLGCWRRRLLPVRIRNKGQYHALTEPAGEKVQIAYIYLVRGRCDAQGTEEAGVPAGDGGCQGDGLGVDGL